ncbi:MAG: O-antigen ligase family protein [Gemmataceae bacterium]|nr:O-antigen ligase family protein [Gemmataceae bacterium]
MHWLLIGYMFLFIDRPFEVWPWLGDLHVERVYMLLTFAVWMVAPGKRFLTNIQQAAYASLALAVLFAWIASPWNEQGQPVVEDWLKIVVFYVLLTTTVNDERKLKIVVVGFVAVMGLYLAHSFREYLGGRHTYRMGIARMIGVDKTLGDPNSFGASIVFVLPFIPAFWRAGVGGRPGKFLLLAFAGLCALCILLTGSRSSLLGMIVWGLMLLVRVRRAWLWALVAAALAPVAFLALPESLQNRFETIVNPEAGPESARESGEGRIEGFFKGLELWSSSPLTGVGPGAWRPATKSKIESHNLYGQLVGETGLVGLGAFVLLLGSYVANLRRVRQYRDPEYPGDFLTQLGSAIGTSVVLLLVMGMFGHNLFRFTWLWYGGFLIIAVHCLRQRSAPVDEEPIDLVPAMVAGWRIDAPSDLPRPRLRPETASLLGAPPR